MTPVLAGSRRNILLIKAQVLVAHESHFAGGIHLFSCLADTLAASGYNVRVITTAKKNLVMHHALVHGLLGSYLAQPAKLGQAELVHWTELRNPSLRYTVVIQPEQTCSRHNNEDSDPNSNISSTPAADLIEAVAAAAAQLDNHCTVILDCDSLQQAVVPISSVATCCCQKHQTAHQQHPQQSVPFLYALLHRLKHRCNCCALPPQSQQCQPQQPQQHPSVLMLVQNLHHLPFGPCGTAPRTLLGLNAWQQADGFLCVSNYVAQYIQQHALPILQPPTSSSNSCRNGSSTSDNTFVLHPAAVGAFGQGPFTNLGEAAAQRLFGAAAAVPEQQQQQQQWRQPPVIGMLKLSREKGSDIFFALAARLPAMQFVGVCADDTMHQHAAAFGVHNVKLLEPQADVGTVLQGLDVVLVPSALHEAFGLVVMDAMLRGIPVIVADAGALPEAAAGAAAAVLPVPLVDFPTAAATAESSAAAVPVHSHTKQQQQKDQHSIHAGIAASAATADAEVCRPQQHSDTSASAPYDTCSARDAVHCKLHQEWLADQRCWDSRLFPTVTQQCVDSWASAVEHVLSSGGVYLQFARQAKLTADCVVAESGVQLQQFCEWLAQHAPVSSANGSD